MAYITALWPITTILGTIPYIGIVLTIVLMVYFYAIAGIEAHKIASQKAWIVSGIIGIILSSMVVGAGISSRMSRGEALTYQKQMEGSAKEMQKNSEAAKKALEELQKKMENK